MVDSLRVSHAETLVALLAATAERLPKRVAIREKRLGIWQEVPWPAYADTVGRLARGLAAVGLRRGQCLAIIAENRPQWLYTELAAQSIGAIPAGIFPSATTDETARLLRRLRPGVIVVEGQEQVDKLLSVRDALGDAAAVIYWDRRGMRAYHDPLLRDLSAVIELGGSEGRLAELAAELKSDDVAEIVFTLAADGEPRGVELTHANLLAAARGFLAVEPLREGDNIVSIAPAPWIGDRVWCTALALSAALTVNFPEEPDTAVADLREIGPQVVAAPPRAWERFRAMVETPAEDAGRLRRWFFRAAIPTEAGAGPRLPGPVADLLVYRPVRDRLGLVRAHRCYTAGGPINPAVLRFFHTIGVPLKQIYSVSEAAGLAGVQPDGAIDAETVGNPLPGITVERAADGEICLKGAAVAGRYHDDADATAVAFRDGWFHTGDLGRIEPDGQIALVERRARVVRLAGGAEVSPRMIEERLKRNPYVREAVVIAEDRAEPAALIAVDAAAGRAWAEHHGHAVTTHAELVRLPGIAALVRDAVRAANEGLPPALHVRCVALIPHELSTEFGELTRIGHVRRAALLEHNAALVAALDGGPDDGLVIAVDRELAEANSGVGD
jgi:long-chain acyl-CoA synthetase